MGQRQDDNLVMILPNLENSRFSGGDTESYAAHDGNLFIFFIISSHSHVILFFSKHVALFPMSFGRSLSFWL
ncbi:hypothetical protein EUGRSUZ_C03203 [Eucalyptus grandis]|uniref:Uncharacterized protein n=2 Tax=Eucalyptus grandis TaxID=71139 RepID=A0A059CTZ6_EUCGR|nr:hypothetical protein EUGRSUZ_C03203 [Eucalyptus grandis]